MDNNILTADEIHTLLDAVDAVNEPWLGYVPDDDGTDPKATREGWTMLLYSARAKLGRQLEAS